ncbi:hypothetical protein [Deinococcus ruber]|uniref:hypothetical protein n=1 Tax=Deinococcus ruber TaxID=1848197 RepID=UPI001667BA9A|nr:hypothetical protein [Deinococcus ruber]
MNRGVTAVIDDLGRVQQRLDHGQGVLHARHQRSEAQTVSVRPGNGPALLAAALLLVGAWRWRPAPPAGDGCPRTR